MSLFSLKKLASKRNVTALIAEDDGLAIASSVSTADGGVSLSACEFVDWDNSTNKRILRYKVRQNGLHKRPFTTSLPLGEYTILSVNAQEVPAIELKSAIRWQIKDLIDFHIDDAVLDVFDAPAAGINGQQKSLYVVVSRRSAVEQYIKPFQDVNANLATIDIPELALRNIVTKLPEDEAGVVFVYLSRHKGLIIITRQNTLYLARSLDVGYEVMDREESMDSEADRLGLEIQRSMDYYDRYFMQPPISGLVIAPMPVEPPGLIERLSENLGIKTSFLDINNVVVSGSHLDAALQSKCLLAIGAALREEKVSL